MKRALILTVTLTVGAGCASRGALKLNNQPKGNQNAQQASGTATPGDLNLSANDSKKPDEKKEVPSEFRIVDFKNFSYPISWKHRTIPLKDGRAEYFQDKYLGNAWFDFDDVDYIDLTGDGNKEAVVQLSAVMCGGSCDGGSALFYFFTSKQGKLTLLSRMETGSIAYECGLKSFTLTGRKLVLEVFRRCSFDGVSLNSAYDADAVGGKFIASEFTRFEFVFKGRRFVQKKRELIANPENNVKNYPSKVSISND